MHNYSGWQGQILYNSQNIFHEEKLKHTAVSDTMQTQKTHENLKQMQQWKCAAESQNKYIYSKHSKKRNDASHKQTNS